MIDKKMKNGNQILCINSVIISILPKWIGSDG